MGAHNPSWISEAEGTYTLQYRFPSLFAVDTFRHFGPWILNSQIKSPFLTRKLPFWSILSMWISEFADKKSANNEGRLYLVTRLMVKSQNCTFDNSELPSRTQFSHLEPFLFLLLASQSWRQTKHSTFFISNLSLPVFHPHAFAVAQNFILSSELNLNLWTFVVCFLFSCRERTLF